jgi:hypothetical protein
LGAVWFGEFGEGFVREFWGFARRRRIEMVRRDGGDMFFFFSYYAAARSRKQSV